MPNCGADAEGVEPSVTICIGLKGVTYEKRNAIFVQGFITLHYHYNAE